MSLVDQTARTLIRTALDKNLVVEAAAGTGKTSELVERIIAVVRAGRTTIDCIAGVTFTEKAAGELKLRLRFELENARRAEKNGKAWQHLEHALSHLEEARVSTIHSFCNDLLRERPVEARIDPQFEVITEQQSRQLYGEAFRSWFQRKLEDLPEGTRRFLRRKNQSSPTESLIRAGWELADWRDFPTRWKRPQYDRKQAIDSIVQKLHELAALTRDPSERTNNLFRDTEPIRSLSESLRAVEQAAPRDYDGLEATLLLWASNGQYERLREPRHGRAKFSEIVKRDNILAVHADLMDAIQSLAGC